MSDLGISTPAEALSEQDYQASAANTERAVVASMQAKRVSIGDMPWVGERAATDADRMTFELSTGTFAGGRFVVWQAQRGLQGELTLYGSGRPIVQSERGPLVRGAR